jgi:hypothetical protein
VPLRKTDASWPLTDRVPSHEYASKERGSSADRADRRVTICTSTSSSEAVPVALVVAMGRRA